LASALQSSCNLLGTSLNELTFEVLDLLEGFL